MTILIMLVFMTNYSKLAPRLIFVRFVTIASKLEKATFIEIDLFEFNVYHL